MESPEKKELNNDFTNWVTKEIGNDGIARLYTLNYDRLFSVILKNRGYDIFEGDKDDKTPSRPFNLKKISSDFETHCHYNLHGSVFWKIDVRNHNDLPSIQYYITDSPRFVSERELPIEQIEKGKCILLTNIIGGYQKIQKTALAPFKQFSAALDRDCLFADKIVIVGYSFGDVHINNSIKTALIHNPDVKIEIIDPKFLETKMDATLGISLFSNSIKSFSLTKVSDKLYSYLEGTVTVKLLKFKEALRFDKFS